MTVRELVGHVIEVLFDLESAFPATVHGLWTRPGQVCRDYAEGKRKHYLNPFAYLLVAITVQVAAEFVVGRIRPEPKPAADLSNDVVTWMLLVSLIPLAAIWVWIFRSSGFNLAENYVVGLYLAAQFTWIEVLLLPVSLLRIDETTLTAAYGLSWCALATWTGVVFYRMSWLAVLWRMIVSTGLALTLVGCVALIIDAILKAAGATGFLQ